MNPIQLEESTDMSTRSIFLYAILMLFNPFVLLAFQVESIDHPLAEDWANLSYDDRLSYIRNEFETALAGGDEAIIRSVVKRRGDFMVELIRVYTGEYLAEATKQKETLPTLSPVLKRASSLATFVAEENGNESLKIYVKTVSSWSQDQLQKLTECYERVERLGKCTNKDEEYLRAVKESELEFASLRDDLGRLDALFPLCSTLLQGGSPDAVSLVKEGLELAENLSDLRKQGLFYYLFAMMHYIQGRIDLCDESLEKSSALLNRFNHGNEKSTVITLKSHVMKRRGRNKEAYTCMQNLIDELLMAGDRKSAANAMLNLASYMQEDGQGYTRIVELLDRAGQIAQEMDDGYCLVNVWSVRGQMLSDLGKIREASGWLEKALDYFRQHEDERLRLTTTNALVETYIASGQFEKAETLAAETIATLKPSSPLIAKIQMLSHLARIDLWDGNSSRANERMKKALKYANLINHPSITSTVLLQQSEILLYESNIDEASKRAEEALRLVDQPGFETDKIMALKNLAQIHERMNQYGRARELLEESLVLLKERKGTVIYNYTAMRLANTLIAQGAYEEAESYLEPVLKFSDQNDLAHMKGDALYGLGRVHAFQGLSERAFARFEKALPVYENLPSLSRAWKTRHRMADALMAREKWDQALTLLETSSGDYMDLSIFPTVYFNHLGMLGRLYLKKGEPKQALDHLVKAIDHQERVLVQTRASSILTRSLFAEEYKWINLDAWACCAQLYERERNDKYLALAFAFQENHKARIWLEELAKSALSLPSSIPDAMKSELSARFSRISRLQKSLDKHADRSDSDEHSKSSQWTSEIKREQEQFDILLAKIRNDDPDCAYMQFHELLSLTDFQALLDKDAAYISFCLGGDQGWVMAVNNDRCLMHRLDANDIASIHEEVPMLIALLRNPSSDVVRFTDVSRRLYLQLLSPLESVFRSKARLLISSDGLLHFLPSGVLLCSDMKGVDSMPFSQLPYLARSYSITYIPSGSTQRLLTMRCAKKKQKSKYDDMKELLAMGGIPYDSIVSSGTITRLDPEGSDTKLEPLIHSGEEIQSIAGLFSDEEVTVLHGKAATESAAREGAFGSYRRIHFATHASVDAESPWQSGILLNPCDEQDGNLQAKEILDSHTHAELVVLSACSTHLGKSVRGEGVFGLVRAFLHSGTDSVVATNWEVRDRFTHCFMNRFYHYMVEKMQPRDRSLQLAKVDALSGRLFIERMDPDSGVSRGVRRYTVADQHNRYSHPYYWAPFALYGLP